MRGRIQLLVSVFGFAGAAAAAQPGDIIVTGQGLPQAQGDLAYDVQTIGRDRIETSASARLEDVLRDVAGFQQFRRSDSRSAHPTSQGASLRGLGGNAASRALVVLDGVPVADPFGGWINWPALDPSRLGLVRVTRGGGAGTFGPGALTGTIELMSATVDELPGAEAEIGYGSRDSVMAVAGASGNLGGGFASLSGRFDRGDGFIPIVRESRGPVDRPAGYEQWSVRARGVAPLGGNTEMQVNASLFGDQRDRGTDFTGNAMLGQDASVRLVGRGGLQWNALAYVQARQFRSQFASIPASRSTVSQSLDQYNTPATGYGLRFELRPIAAERAELRVGADYHEVVGRTKERFTFVAGAPTRLRDAGGRNRTFGGFAEASVRPVAGLTLTGGGRIDRWQILDGRLREKTIATGALIRNEQARDRSDWESTGRIGLAWQPAPAVTLRSAGYLGYRLPTLNELYRPFRAGADATAANAALQPEKLKGVEAGIVFQPATNARASATIFWNRLDNAIANVSVPLQNGLCTGVGFVSGACRKRLNVDAIRARGIELDAGISHGAWDISGSYVYADSKVRASGLAVALDGLRPAQTPRHQASATIGWRGVGDIHAALTGRYLSGQFEDDLNQRRLDDALTFDAVLSAPLGGGIVAEVRGENLADARVETAISADGVVERASPRTVWLSLRYRMK